MGVVGVKVWIYKGDILPEPKQSESRKNGAHNRNYPKLQAAGCGGFGFRRTANNIRGDQCCNRNE